MFYSEQLREQDPTMHQSTISGATKTKWSSMTRDEQEVWLAPARAEMEDFKAKNPGYFKERALRAKRKQASNLDDQKSSKKQKNPAPLPFPDAEPPMAYQFPTSIPLQSLQPPPFLPQGLEYMAAQAPVPMQQLEQPLCHQSHQQLLYTAPVPMPHTQEAPKLPLQVPEQAEYIDPLLEQMRFENPVAEAQQVHQKEQPTSETQAIESHTGGVQDGQAIDVHKANEVRVTNATLSNDKEDEELRLSLQDIDDLFGGNGADYNNESVYGNST
ncbi:hypothetical protein GGR51DRAFT_578506 [Nemania sp. FL0031]|nr:hypothetical protein GGR51DRAFT_578506 [Nemania sp. FL0031]